MPKILSILGDLRIANYASVPQAQFSNILNPKPGTILLANLNLYTFVSIGGIRAWYPLISEKNKGYFFSQTVASADWVLTHNLNTVKCWYQIVDSTGAKVTPKSTTIVNNNTVHITFNTPIVCDIAIVDLTDDLVDNNPESPVIALSDYLTIDPTGSIVGGLRIVKNASIMSAGDGIYTQLAFEDQQQLNNGANPVVDPTPITPVVPIITATMLGLGQVNNTSDLNKPVSIAQAAAIAVVAASVVDETNARIAGDAATLASAKAYTDNAIVNLWDDRGNYDASGGTYPTTGGSGANGSINKGDVWTIHVEGTINGIPLALRETIRALVDNPGQADINWAIGSANTNIADSVTLGVTGVAPSQNAVALAISNATTMLQASTSPVTQNAIDAAIATEVINRDNAIVIAAKTTLALAKTYTDDQIGLQLPSFAGMQAQLDAAVASIATGDNLNAKAIVDETKRALGAEGALQSSIDGLVVTSTQVSALVAAETSRAQTAETTLTTNLGNTSQALTDLTKVVSDPKTGLVVTLGNEIARATAAEAILQADMTNIQVTANAQALSVAAAAQAGLDAVNAALAAEVARAQTAEGVESARAIAAETALQTNLTNAQVTANALAMAAAATAQATADTANTNLGLLGQAVSDQNGRNAKSFSDLTLALNNEVTRATGVEAGLQTAISNAQLTVSGVANQALSTANQAVTDAAAAMKAAVDEKNRATTVEAVLTSAVQAAAADAAFAKANMVSSTITINNKSLTSSITITKADVGLGNVDNTPDSLKPVSAAQATAIAAETSRAQAAETALQSSIATTNSNVSTINGEIATMNNTINVLSVGNIRPAIVTDSKPYYPTFVDNNALYQGLDPANLSGADTLSPDGLTLYGSGTVSSIAKVSTGIWYWEVYFSDANAAAGIADANNVPIVMVNAADGKLLQGRYSSPYGPALGGTTVGFLLDGSSGTFTLSLYINGALFGLMQNTIPGSVAPVISSTSTAGVTVNFGSSPFKYTVPTGATAGYYDTNVSRQSIIDVTGTLSYNPVTKVFTIPHLNTGANTFSGAQSMSSADKGTVSTGTITLSASDGNVQKLTIAGAVSLAVNGWPSPGIFGEVLIRLVNAGAYAVTMPSNINWPLPTTGAPATSFAAYLTAIGRTSLQTAGSDFIYLWSDDGGFNVYGKLL